MSKTIEIRKVIKKLLKESHERIFYENASDKAPFPYIVFNIESINFDNEGRDDLILTIDIWDKNKDSTAIEILADNVEDTLDFRNNPTETVLPTFYKESRRSLSDEDKSIRRRQLTFLIQNYYTGR